MLWASDKALDRHGKRVDKALFTNKEIHRMERQLVHDLIVPPSMQMSRRKIASRFSQLTSDDWRKWTLGISQCLLHDTCLSLVQFQHWLLFVEACKLVTRPSITRSQARQADQLFCEFGNGVRSLYGRHAVTINMHLHAHLVDNLLDFGPVYSFWCFGFERYNGIIKNINTNQRGTFELTFMKGFLQKVYQRDLLAPLNLPDNVSR
ncbi:hypothetical protein DM01DRAFT_1294826, partial [Hesseltinella vesiculosa]